MEKDKVSLAARIKERDILKARFDSGASEADHLRYRAVVQEIEGLCK